MSKQKSQSTLVGASGEHFVLYRLLRMGYLAALAPQRAPNADIIVTDLSGKKFALVQVKTRRDIGSDKGWHMKQKHESLISKQMYYCFVDLQENDSRLPSVYIIPSKVVAEALLKTNEVWLKTPGKNGKKHTATVMRRLLPDYSRALKLKGKLLMSYGKNWIEPYRENWKILGLD